MNTLTSFPAAMDTRINGARLWQSLMDLARIGATPKGGVCRLALTALDGQGRDLFVRWAREAGCSIRIDAIGNIFARRSGRDNSLPPVMTGSHIDTQPTGGKFDGNYGVLAGLEVARSLNDAGVETVAPIEVAVWTNEEGSRFVPVMMGSACSPAPSRWSMRWRSAMPKASASARPWRPLAMPVRQAPRLTSVPISRPISSKAQYWRPTTA